MTSIVRGAARLLPIGFKRQVRRLIPAWLIAREPELSKAGMINHLAGVHGYRRYLELCTPSTGLQYARIDRSKLLTCTRLMYRCSDDYDDGMVVDHRSADLDIAGCLQEIRRKGQAPFDIALIDSYHEYGTSWRDLVEGFHLLRPGGTLMVHDCLPPTAEIAGPEFESGAWCGVTYQAFIDFVSSRDDLAFYTVDTDYGCGVVRKLAGPSAAHRPGDRASTDVSGANNEPAALFKEWQARRDDHRARFAFLQAHKHRLLNLISIEEFFARERRSTAD